MGIGQEEKYKAQRIEARKRLVGAQGKRRQRGSLMS